MFELRVLSGLHRGAVLPLDDSTLVIGASDETDIVLVDPGVKDRHASLSRTEEGWVLSHIDGQIFSSGSDKSQVAIDLVPGDFVRLGQVWLTVVEEGAPWEDVQHAPYIPANVPEPEEVQRDAAAMLEAETSGDYSQAALQERPKKSVFKRRMFFLPLMAASVISAATAYPIPPKGVEAVNAAELIARARLTEALGQGNGEKIRKDAFDESVAAMAAKPKLTSEQLRVAFQKRLRDVDLIQHFDLQLEDNAWTMRASLDAEEGARFERMLVKFIKENSITFPVNAKISNAEGMLPFKVMQVISGANASIVTEDNTRLYVGDEYQGFRVVAIRGNHLVFAGKRKIEMNW